MWKNVIFGILLLLVTVILLACSNDSSNTDTPLEVSDSQVDTPVTGDTYSISYKEITDNQLIQFDRYPFYSLVPIAFQHEY